MTQGEMLITRRVQPCYEPGRLDPGVRHTYVAGCRRSTRMRSTLQLREAQE